jgi:hypothetical protein
MSGNNMQRNESMWDALMSDNGLRSLFVVIFVATILTFYEIGMFYFVVTPQVKKQVDVGLKKATQAVKADLDKTTKEYTDKYLKNSKLAQIEQNNIIDQFDKYFDTNQFNIQDKKQDVINNIENTKKFTQTIFDTLKSREDVLIEKINGYTKVTGMFIIITLFVIMLVINYTMTNRNSSLGNCVWINAGVTLALIFIFQYRFYYLGVEYKYIGSKGQDELIYNLYKNI